MNNPKQNTKKQIGHIIMDTISGDKYILKPVQDADSESEEIIKKYDLSNEVIVIDTQNTNSGVEYTFVTKDDGKQHKLLKKEFDKVYNKTL